MNIETKGLGAGSYPEPKEIEEKDIEVKVYLTCAVGISVPKYWNIENIVEYIKTNLSDFVWDKEEIEAVEVN